MYLILIDAFSKWVQAYEMRDISAKATVEAFKEYVAAWGLPIKVVTDNGPAFVAREFQEFLHKNNIIHLTSPPYHPASNGAAENAVKTFKISSLSSVNRNSNLRVNLSSNQARGIEQQANKETKEVMVKSEPTSTEATASGPCTQMTQKQSYH
ncbi:uncharacterized protein K02A2.6-like [Copidosoma floridanum]|uniref:uncharacterized protein K02A2.6-like n=1 Tax=Copidosoma floridanum TaxID=29053 RepID=UPI0006C964DA|nr:uncharacterized protein K02A2.6-like [Copidosoma floridanum]